MLKVRSELVNMVFRFILTAAHILYDKVDYQIRYIGHFGLHMKLYKGFTSDVVIGTHRVQMNNFHTKKEMLRRL